MVCNLGLLFGFLWLPLAVPVRSNAACGVFPFEQVSCLVGHEFGLLISVLAGSDSSFGR